MVIIIPIKEEEYKLVTYPGVKKDRYIVSNYGNIINLKTGKKKELNPHKNNKYVTGKFKMEDGSKKIIAIHRIVGYEFVEGYNPSLGRDQINHKDTIRNHNYYENLEWVTISENNYYKFKHGAGGTNPPIMRGEDSPCNIYPTEFIKSICELLESNSIIGVMKGLGYKGQNDNKKIYNLIYDIKRGNAWTHISKDYDFRKSIVE